MRFKNKILSRALSITALLVVAQSVHAVPYTFEGRSLGMGGASVATADLATAAWANPAMLTNQRPDDDFSLLIGVGAFVRDNDDLMSDIDDFQEADARREAGLAAGGVDGAAQAFQAVDDMVNIIQGIDGKNMALDASGVAAMGIAFESFAMAVSIRSDAIGAGTVTNLSATPAQVIDPAFNILNIEGVLATEVGLSLAKDFQVAGRKLSVGIKPKIVDLKSFSLAEPILTTDGIDDVLNQDNEFDIDTFTTIDVGLAYDLSDTFRLGLNIRNLINDEFDVVTQSSGGAVTHTLNFDTEARIGLAYHNRLLTVGLDYDLIENEPLLSNPTFKGLKTQFVALGAEFNAFDFVQLRVGAAKNLASGVSGGSKDPVLTAGVGLWLGFNLDIAATFSDNSVGGFLQTGFRF